MAKDDYDVLVFKILTYLYRKLKDGYCDDTYLFPLTNDFPVQEDYFVMIFEELEDKQLIKGFKVIKAWGGDIACYDLSKARITGDGIAYLRDNSRMRKVIDLVKEARAIMSLWS